jgi:hypothetical protein
MSTILIHDMQNRKKRKTGQNQPVDQQQIDSSSIISLPAGV